MSDNIPTIHFTFYKQNNKLFTNDDFEKFISICKIFPAVEVHPSVKLSEVEEVYGLINKQFTVLLATKHKTYIDTMLEMINRKYIVFKDNNPYKSFTDEFYLTLYLDSISLENFKIYDHKEKLFKYMSRLEQISSLIQDLIIEATSNSDILISPVKITYDKKTDKLIAEGKREYIEKYIALYTANKIIDIDADFYEERINLLNELIYKNNCKGNFLYFINTFITL